MTWFHPTSKKIFHKPPKVLRVDEGGFQVIGGIRTTFKVMRDLKGLMFQLDLFGKRITISAYLESIKPKHWYIIIDNRKHKPPFNEWSAILFGRLYLLIGIAYGGYLAQ